MPLVNSVQIPQNCGMNAQPIHPAAQQDVFKMAGAKAALIDLGLLPPEEMEKEAYAGLLRGAWGLLSSAGKGLWGAGGKAVGTVAKPFGTAANRAVERVGGRLGWTPERIAKIKGLGEGAAREAVGFGALSGGIGALTAEPGQRGEAFLRGAAGGALGGLAWRGAGNVARMGLKRGIGGKIDPTTGVRAHAGRLEGVEAAAKQPWFGGKMGLGQRAKGWGAKALMGGVPFAAGMGASMMMPTFEGGHGAPRTQAQRFAPYAARLGGGMMGAYPSHPMGYRAYQYNPNLPMPQ